METAILILGIIEQLAKAANQMRADAVQNAQWTPEQVKAFDDRLAAALASDAWKTDEGK